MTCTTHHHACDCREATFRGLEAENERLKDELDLAEKQAEANYEEGQEMRAEREGLKAKLAETEQSRKDATDKVWQYWDALEAYAEAEKHTEGCGDCLEYGEFCDASHDLWNAAQKLREGLTCTTEKAKVPVYAVKDPEGRLLPVADDSKPGLWHSASRFAEGGWPELNEKGYRVVPAWLVEREEG